MKIEKKKILNTIFIFIIIIIIFYGIYYLYKYDDLGENNNLDDFKRLGNLNYSLVGLCIYQIIKKNVDKNKLETTSDRYFTDEKIIKEIINSHICSFVIKIVNKRKHLNFRIYTSN